MFFGIQRNRKKKRSDDTDQSSRMVQGVQPPRIPRCQSGAAERRLFPADRRQGHEGNTGIKGGGCACRTGG